MTEATEQFAARLAEDLERILGTGIVLDEVEFGPGDDDAARIRVLCLFDGRTEVLEANGETRQETYNRLIKAAADLRLALSSRTMIAPM
jgi:hypothetical protein